MGRSLFRIGIAGIVVFGLVLTIGLIQPRAKTDKEAPPPQNPMKERLSPPADPLAGPQLVEMPSDRTFGSTKPDRILTIGFQWSPSIQGNPRPMALALEEFCAYLDKARGHIREELQVRVANSDLHPEVPLGIYVDGVFLSIFDPHQMSPSVASHIVQSLMEHLNSTLAPTPLQRERWKKLQKG